MDADPDFDRRMDEAAARVDAGQAGSMFADAEMIARLGRLDTLAYDRCRAAEAERMGVRVAVLDAEVQAFRMSTRPARSNGANEVAPPPFSDDALALRFSARHDGELLYVPAWNSWRRWDGCRWVKDDVLTVYDKARIVCREAASEADTKRDGETTATNITSARTVAAVERLARCDRRHARSADAFDADPWLLNTPGCVVDLRTGAQRMHDPAEMHTKAAGTSPGGECPRFLAFMDQITKKDAPLIGYIQRAIGYTLTGSIEEHAFFFLHGPGANGKSVLLSTVGRLLGDYATTAMQDVFVLSRGNEGHASRLAALQGARMVTVSETEEGKPWAEARIKSWTGGDKVSANLMHQNPVEFAPVCKLWFSGNHKPPLRNPDAAMRRRMNLIPLTYVPAKPDPALPAALEAELPGILAWAIQGCLAWQAGGLKPPPVVTEATDTYFEDQNAIDLWLAESCDSLPDAQSASRALFKSWRAWADARGDDPGSETRFSMELEKKFTKKKTPSGMAFKGLAIRPPPRTGRDPE